MQQFFEYKYKSGHNVISHISAIELMAARLRDLKDPVTDTQVMTKIMVTLPPSYRHFLFVWDNVPPNERNNLSLLTQRLVKEENVAKLYNQGQAGPADAAFFSSNQDRSSYPSTITHNRGSRGGFGPQRRGQSNGRNHPYPQSSRNHCFYCSHPTQVVADCRYKKRDERNGIFVQSMVASTQRNYQYRSNDYNQQSNILHREIKTMAIQQRPHPLTETPPAGSQTLGPQDT